MPKFLYLNTHRTGKVVILDASIIFLKVCPGDVFVNIFMPKFISTLFPILLFVSHPTCTELHEFSPYLSFRNCIEVLFLLVQIFKLNNLKHATNTFAKHFVLSMNTCTYKHQASLRLSTILALYLDGYST